MHRGFILISLAVFGFSAPVKGTEEPKAVEPANPDLYVHEALEHVRDLMLDPDSVLFRNVVYAVKEKPQTYAVCGEFNAKNAFRGYTGYKPFAYERRDPSSDSKVFYVDKSKDYPRKRDQCFDE